MAKAPALWPASDAICASLQVINHLQDCAQDYARLDRVYLPEDALARAGASVADLKAPRASPELRAAIVDLAQKSGALLDQGADLDARVGDWRLACEIGAIVRLARANVDRLMKYDPLSERCPPEQGRVRVDGPDRRRARRDRAGQGRRRARAGRGEKQMNAPSPEPARAARQFVLCRDARTAATTSGRRCSISTDSAARSTTSPTIARVRERPRHSELQAWRDRYRCNLRRPSAAGARRARAHDREPTTCSAWIFSPSSTAWTWMWRPTSERPIGRRSISIATASPAPSVVCRRASSASMRATANALAEHLGRALQLTNILRDLDEDQRARPPLSAARGVGQGGHCRQRSGARARLAGAWRRGAAGDRGSAAAVSPREGCHGRNVPARPCARRA